MVIVYIILNKIGEEIGKIEVKELVIYSFFEWV